MTANLIGGEQRCLEAIVAFIHRKKRMPTMRELAGELGVGRSYVTRVLDQLAEKGAIKRNPAGTLPIELKVDGDELKNHRAEFARRAPGA